MLNKNKPVLFAGMSPEVLRINRKILAHWRKERSISYRIKKAVKEFFHAVMEL